MLYQLCLILFWFINNFCPYKQLIFELWTYFSHLRKIDYDIKEKTLRIDFNEFVKPWF